MGKISELFLFCVLEVDFLFVEIIIEYGIWFNLGGIV